MIKSIDDYNNHYKSSVKNPEKYWKEYANNFIWKKYPKKVLAWNFNEPDVKWFEDGKLNITENIFERNENNKDDIAIIWEPNEPDEKNKIFTYDQLFKEVCSFSNVLKKM